MCVTVREEGGPIRLLVNVEEIAYVEELSSGVVVHLEGGRYMWSDDDFDEVRVRLVSLEHRRV